MKRISSFTLLILSVIVLYGQRNYSTSATPRPQAPAPLKGNGLKFTENKGQVVDMQNQLRPDVLFKGETPGNTVYLRRSGISYVLSSPDLATDLKNKNSLQRVDMDFDGCNPNPVIQTADRVDGYSNYYYSHCPDGITYVNSYNKVTYQNVYKNIDLIYYGSKESGLKYDIVVRPGGNPNEIKLRYSGADKIEISNSNRPDRAQALMIRNSITELTERMPKVYQKINGNISDVKAEYKLSSSTEKGGGEIVTFKLGNFNRNFPLIIDPFMWATYYGGNGNDNSHGIAVDPNGNIVVSGYTVSSNLPTTAGSFQQALTAASDTDGFVTKFDSNGKHIWSTYYGSVGETAFEGGIATDPFGNVMITGKTSSATFPVASASQPAFGGFTDAYVVKFNSAGVRQWATYYGGTGSDEGGGITSDPSGNVIITGKTWKNDFPVSPGAFQTVFKGNMDAFVVKFDPAGTRLWATFVGGSDLDWGKNISTNPAGEICVMGGSASYDFPVKNAFQPTQSGGFVSFVLKFDSGGGLLWSTYLGNNQSNAWGDPLSGLAIDLAGNVVVCGSTNDASFPVSAGAWQSAPGGNYDIFIAKYDPNGVRLWATYYGGTKNDCVSAMTTDKFDNIYLLTGWLGYPGPGNFPITACAAQKTFGGVGDVTVSKFDPAGQQVCATFVGGPLGETICYDGTGGIVADGDYVYVTANNVGGSFPVTPKAYQTTYGGGKCDAFITKICSKSCGDNNVLTYDFTGTQSAACNNPSVQFSPTVSSTTACDNNTFVYAWTFTGGTPATSSNQNETVTFPSAGNYDVTLVLTGICINDTLTKTITVTGSPPIVPTISSSPAICANTNGSASASATGGGGTFSYSWSTSATSQTINGLAPQNYTVTITDGNGCTATSTTAITTSGGIVSTMGIPGSVSCAGGADGTASVTVAGGTGNYTYKWSNGAFTIASSASDQLTNLTAQNYTVTVIDANGCQSTSSTTVNSSPAINPVTGATPSACSQSNGGATVSATGGAGNFDYSWSNGATGQTINGLIANSYTVTITDGNTCTKTAVALVNNTGGGTASTSVLSDVKCNGGSTGSATSSAVGGTPSYTYTWNTGATAATISNVAAGIYTVTVFDSNNCKSISTVTISEPVSIQPVTTATPATCGNNNGKAYVSATGGSGALSYSWSTASTAQTISGLAAQNYTVTVTDFNSCSVTTIVTVLSSGGPTATMSAPTQIKCTGDNNGSASVTIAGGATNYTYSWSAGASSITTSLSSQISNLTAQGYTVTITDGNGCQTTASVTLSAPPLLVPATTVSPSNCGQNNGVASVSTTGGTGSVTYTWSTGSTALTINNLQVQSYTVTATDGNGCSKTAVAAINGTGGQTAIATIISNVSCNGGGNGSAVSSASGGTPGYTYSWSNGPTTATSTNLAKGIYSVTVVDANKCQSVSSVSISEPTAIVSSASSSPDVCGAGVGNAVASVSGGTPGYKYLWSNSATGATASNLIAGVYSVTVTDANNCTATISTNVGTSGSVIADAGTDQKICLGKAVPLNATGGSTYSWTPSAGLSSATIQNPTAAPIVTTKYYVTATTGSCKGKDSVTVTVDPLPLADAGLDETITTGKNITLNASGGTSYLWVPPVNLTNVNSANPTFGPASEGVYKYIVLITDANGCSAIDSVKITVKELKCGDGAFVPTAFSPNGDGQNDVLLVRGSCIKTLSLLIYDRWGEKVFETTNQADGWDGKFNGKECDTAAFVYYLKAELIDATVVTKKGNITLVR